MKRPIVYKQNKNKHNKTKKPRGHPNNRTHRIHPHYQHKKNPTVVIGLIYADWCGHCNALKEDWNKLKHQLYEDNKNYKKYHYVIREINQSNNDKDHIVRQTHHELPAKTKGFPTLFRIEGGKLQMFEGQREYDTMYKWSRGEGEGGETKPIDNKNGIFGNIFGGYPLDVNSGNKNKTRSKKSGNRRISSSIKKQ